MAWIELAPRHKQGLPIPSPVMPAAGTFGYGPEYRDLMTYKTADGICLLGAIVTNPVSLKPRHAANTRRVEMHKGQMLVHTGLPNAGLKAVLREYRSFWQRQGIPVIVHLIATNPYEVAKASGRLSRDDSVAGIELGLRSDISLREALDMLYAAQDGSEKPVIVRVPFENVNILAPALAEEGADCLTLTAPPRGLLPTGDNGGEEGTLYMRGRLYSPAMFPLLLQHLSTWCRALETPVIACGGISSLEDAQACLDLGAKAVQIDTQLWQDPGLLPRIAQALSDRQKEEEEFSLFKT